MGPSPKMFTILRISETTSSSVSPGTVEVQKERERETRGRGRGRGTTWVSAQAGGTR